MPVEKYKLLLLGVVCIPILILFIFNASAKFYCSKYAVVCHYESCNKFCISCKCGEICKNVCIEYKIKEMPKNQTWIYLNNITTITVILNDTGIYYPKIITTTSTTLPLVPSFNWTFPKCCNDVPYHLEHKNCKIEGNLQKFNMTCESVEQVYEEECWNGRICYTSLVNGTYIVPRGFEKTYEKVE